MLVHLGKLEGVVVWSVATPDMEWESVVSHCPIWGKLLGTHPRAIQASSERYMPGTVLDRVA